MSLGQSIRSGVKWLALGNVARRFLEFAYGVVLARLLVPADFGMIVTVQVFTGVVGLFATGGMGQALIRAKQADERDFTAIFTFQMGLGILIYLTFFLAAPLLADYLENPIYKDLIRVSTIIFLLRPFTLIRNTWLSREMRFKTLTYMRLGAGIMTGVFSVGMAWYGLGVWSLTLSGLFATFIMNVVMSRFIPIRPRFNPDLAIIRKHSAFGMKITANDFITYLRTEAKHLIISKMAGPAFLGLFNKAESMARMPNQMIMPATMEPLFRALSKVQDNLDQTKYMFYRSVTLLMAYTAPIYVLLWWVAEPFIFVVYGEKWQAAGAPMSILALGGFFLNVIYPCGVVLSVQNRLGKEMVAQLVNLGFVIAACYYGLDWGLEGVAWGIILGYALMATHLYWLVRHTLPTRAMDLFRAVLPGLGLASLVCGVMALAHYLLAPLLSHPFLYLAVMSGIGGLVHALAFLFLPIPALATEAGRWRGKLRSSLGMLTLMEKNAMTRRSLFALLLLTGAVAAAAAVYLLGRPAPAAQGPFVESAFPLSETERLFDIGVVDADGDDRLDVYTSNHHFRQALLLADGKGGYRDVLSGWGLDQSSEFPLAELSFITPKPDQPGVYVYWRGTNLVIRTHGGSQLGNWKGLLHTEDPVEVIAGSESVLAKEERKSGIVTETWLTFTGKGDDQIVLQPGGQGLPIYFEISGDLTPTRIFVGRGKVSPRASRFTLAMQDRHAHAWADFNDDGLPDIFINRGALSGTLRAHGEQVTQSIRDELFLSQAPGRFREAARETGIRKEGCSGRHAKWVDYDGDGRLDLFVNCYDREHVAGDFPKQLYRQTGARTLVNVAAETGMALPDQQMGNMAWLDVDQDGDSDLIAFQNAGVFLYRNQDNRYVQETVVLLEPKGAPKIGETNRDYWIYDGKLAVMDYDADGDLDVFLATRRGNRLLLNRDGRLESVLPNAIGLPEASAAANWADHDNDGLPDLHLFPQGLFRQQPDHGFAATGLLAARPEEFQAGIINWADLDNDGRLDALMALERDPAYQAGQDAEGKKRRKKGSWILTAHRNTLTGSHWLQVRLAGSPGNRSAIGAQVTVVSPLGRLTQEVGSSEGAFYSQGHYRLHFGLGAHAKAQEVRVRWSDGAVQILRDVAADRLLVIQQQTATHSTNPAASEARR